MPGEIKHLLVLMLENRSFDHMLGFLDHPEREFRGLTRNEANVWAPGAPPALVSGDAEYQTAIDPGHHHENVICQLTGLPELHERPNVNNSGFAYDYSLVSVKNGLSAAHGAEIMKCFASDRVPVLSTLAKEFAVCDHWFCSVPGATWPNRNFAVAATSDGEVNIKKRPYRNRTIFELLEEEGRTWRIYHDGIPQLWAFPRLWARIRRRWFKPVRDLFEAIRLDELPDFAFIEPDHFGRDSNSQHPGNNVGSARDFLAGETLVGDIYSALLSKPEVFLKTLLLITYDEHGGYYDHEPPPRAEHFEDDKEFTEGTYCFRFDLLGPRVPAVLVSPLIPAGTVLPTDLDHSSIVATARTLFARNAEPLTSRDMNSETFHAACSLRQARTPQELPTLPQPVVPIQAEALVQESELPVSTLDEFQMSLLWLADHVEQAIKQERFGGPDAASRGLWWDSTRILRADVDTVGKADTYQDHVVNLFRQSATE